MSLAYHFTYVWEILEKCFASISRSHVLQLKSNVQSLKKGSSSIDQYLHQLKDVTDSLAAAGHLVDDTDLIFHTLNGLPSKYDAFSMSICVRGPLVTPDELHSLLLTEEIALESRTKNLLQVEHNPQVFLSQRHSSFYNNRGNPRTGQSYRGKGKRSSFLGSNSSNGFNTGSTANTLITNNRSTFSHL